ncbi:uncharacterized protein LOC109829038 [Asparagus officinalis]|uniref:uncharacterized protein LOC109829038 n=1 Tax=Asparagus officinalis TaxID=4686 RepID=UPI00098E17CB|nr:uncharacterized protein LOC109829038 [Asparagus officinalis]
MKLKFEGLLCKNEGYHLKGFRCLHADLDFLGVDLIRSLAREKFPQHPPLQQLPLLGSSSPRAAFLLMLILVVAGRSSLQLPSGSELRSHEHSVAQLMATVARKDTGRAELLSSLDSGREEVARLKEALRHAEESVTLIAEDLAGLERSREQTLEKLGSTQERMMKLKNEAAKILSSSEDSVRASLQAELEQSYVDRLSSLESYVLSRQLPSG